MKLTKLALACVFAASVVPVSSLAVNASNNGTVTFTGTVVETPCNIQQESLKQTVDFGQLSKKALESGQPAEANFDIKFTGCDLEGYGEASTGGGSGGQTRALKSMMMTFTGQNYVGTAGDQMLQTTAGNVNNVGIAIDGFKFGEAKDVIASMINPIGDNVLNFTALAKRVDAKSPVGEGKFEAISNFRITYQ
ncbi:fimbrial protein [Providencia sp. JUb39]|uniref:fimbrial protein n=1 Tax=Providencia sp. JUb39 TaxID=2724165 RepID=UPI00164D3284|nr:fimbrial protein [Providencia sp. JUb39]MBC5791456.1 type 1 fimbrial protein [Providencia sp. JUb39]